TNPQSLNPAPTMVPVNGHLVPHFQHARRRIHLLVLVVRRNTNAPVVIVEAGRFALDNGRAVCGVTYANRARHPSLQIVSKADSGERRAESVGYRLGRLLRRGVIGAVTIAG
ncbi:MAG TPA: hypothetical protein P5307_24010, partial [Pirellulaceae bacterium]|nr:hypothetical protein [Pirellulaceae bacterium]